jgi:hypothetical protein
MTNRVDAQIVLRELYETHFGIYNHADPVLNKDRPFSSVAYHPCESINDFTLMEDRMRNYINFGIYETFHMTFQEYLSFPFDWIETLNKIAQESLGHKGNIIGDVERELKRINKKK